MMNRRLSVLVSAVLLTGTAPFWASENAWGAVPAKEGNKAGEPGNAAPVIRLWPIEMVGGEQSRLKEKCRDRRGRKQLCGVLDPNLTVYRAKSDRPTSVLVFLPGGRLHGPRHADAAYFHGRPLGTESVQGPLRFPYRGTETEGG